MKKKTNFILLTLLLVLCGAFFGPSQKVEAATVTKVTHVVKTYQTSGFPKQCQHGKSYAVYQIKILKSIVEKVLLFAMLFFIGYKLIKKIMEN